MRSYFTSAAACLGILISAGAAGAATVSFTFDGDAGTMPAGWTSTDSISSGSSLTPLALDGNGNYANLSTTVSGGQVFEVSGFKVEDRASGTDFTVTTEFSVSEMTIGGASWNFQIGLNFLATSPTEGATEDYYRLFVYRDNETAQVELQRFVNGSGSTVDSKSAAFGYLAPTGGVYTLSVTGTYLPGGSLKLDYSVASDSKGTVSDTYTDASPLDGEYFGVRTRSRVFSGGTNKIGTTFHSFTVDYVPEPAALGLLGLGSLLCLRRRR